MDESDSMLECMATDDTQAEWDVEMIAERISRSLDGSVSRKKIRTIVEEVMPRYEDARIQTFVPILIQRDVMNELFAKHEPTAAPGVGMRGDQQPQQT